MNTNNNHQWDREDMEVLQDFITSVRQDEPDEEQWQSARLHLAQTLQQKSKESPIMTFIRQQYDKTQHLNFWSRSLAYTAFVAVLAGVILFASGVFNQPATPAFAEVLEQIRSVQTLRFTSTVEMPNQSASILHTDYKEPGKQRVTSPNGNINIMDMANQKALSLIPSEKKACPLDFSQTPNQPAQPNFIQSLQKLQNGAEIVLGHKEIDGKLTCGYQVNQGGADYTIWADLKTGLPVRIEVKMAMYGDMTVTLTDFEFNPPLDDSLFSTEPPADYEIISMPKVDTTPPTESEFIESLHMVTDAKGIFPDTLTLQDMSKLLGTRFSSGKPTNEEIAEFTAQFAKLTRGLLFYQLNAKNDWHYVGKGVQRGGKEVVCWWRPVGSETYRVIYANLTAADVRPEDFSQGKQ